MEDLYYQQLELSDFIRKIPINIKKDSAERKSDDYLRKRQELYTAAKEVINGQRLLISSKQISAKTIWKTTSRSEEEDQEEENQAGAGSSGGKQLQSSILRTTESRGSTSKLDDIIRKQNANFKAFKRSAGLIDVDSMSEKWEMEDALMTLQARWAQIDSLHWEIDSEIGGDNEEYEEIYSQHERSFIHLKKAINKRLWSVSHREHSTPKMDIPVFSGNYQQWTSFKDLFTEAVHNNPILSQAQKMQFLKGKVRGEAERVIQHLPISSDNYKTCWEILNHRYSNKKLIFTSIMNTLLGLPTTQHQVSGNIKKLHDVALESLHAIKNLGINVSSWDPILVHLLSQKLDSETHGDYITSLKNSRELPVLQEFLDYLESKFTSLETSRRKIDQVPKSNFQTKECCEKPVRRNPGYINKFNNHPTYAKALHVSTIRCQICNYQHAVFRCTKFLKLSNEAKLNAVLKFNLCKNCLFDHKGQQCISDRRCRKCSGNHHSVLHDACTNNKAHSNNATIASNLITQDANVTITAHTSQNKHKSNEVLLATALVKVTAIDGSYHILRALIDPGSQVSLIRESAAKKLGLQRTKFNGLIFGVGEVENNCNGVVKLNCASTYNDFSFTSEVIVINNLLKDIPHKAIDTSKWSYIQNLKLADPYFNVSRPVDLLLSAQIYGMILLGGLMKGESLSQPVLQETQLGWIICGGGQASSFQCNVVMNNIEDIQKFWEIEDISEDSNLSSEDQECVDFYSSTTERRQDGRYVVRLPIKQDIQTKLGSSKEMAIAQFYNLERKFSKQPILAEQYKSFISEYTALGHMVLGYNNKHALSCYLPHHAVLKAESETTKLRVVFNASARTSSGYSLNDLMFKGPNLQQDLQGLLLKWRQYQYAYTSDIEKMYRQIYICEKDQKYQQIIWRESTDQPVQTYNLTTVTYGTKSAPFLAMMTLKRLASDERIKFPEAAKILEDSCYMDDVVHGFHDISQGQQLIENLNSMLKLGGFTLRKWSTNQPELLKNIQNCNKEGDLIFNFKSENTSKTLGLRWIPRDDKFTFQFNLSISNTKITKRLLLSEISKVFDPLGWLSPFTTKLKLIFQSMWLHKTHWDEEVPENIKKEWLAVLSDIKNLEQCEIPRWIGYSPKEVIELHGYCDASNKAYAAVIYARIRKENKHSVVLLVAKTRLVPISKNISLPRLELSGAYLLAKLMNKVTNCYSELDIRLYGWTDSMVVLGWLQGDPNRWKAFIANRVQYIIKIMKPNVWRYVKSEENPTDAASRGILASQLIKKTLWWQGPQTLLSFDENRETKQTIYTTEQEIKTKLITSKVNSVQNNAKYSIIKQLLFKFSSFYKIIRVMAWVLRAIKTLQFDKKLIMSNKHIGLPGFLTISELKKAKWLIIKFIQRTEFLEEIQSLRQHGKLHKNSNLLKLNPFIDNQGILRVGGRLSNSVMSMEMKHPAVLPHNSRLTILLIQQAHLLTFHGGPRLTLFNLRQNYWIIGGNKAIRKEVRNCVTCRKHEPKLQHQLMGELPEARSNPAPPFYHTGVDYTGYVYVKSSKGRGIKTTKGYIAVFICMATKAIHLELISDLSSSGFLAALRRMAARRGAPRHLYSDNGTNFVGANRFLQESYHDFKNEFDESFFAELTDLNIEWHFNAPSWPSAGGLWERAVRSLKHHLKRVIGDQKLTYEEYSTVLAQLEACLNSRPLCALSEDIDDLNILTPAHFLIGRCGTNIIETEKDAQTRWHLSAKLVQDIWKKWKSEYLTQLSIRSKWRATEQNIKIGDLVTIQEDNLPPGKWMLGRVTKTHPGQDGLIRVVTLKTKGGFIKRPVVKLSILPIMPNACNTEDKNIYQHCEPKKEYKTKTRIRQTSKLVSVAMSLIFFVSLITSSYAAFNISQLPNNNSLYFDSINNMQVIRDRWNLIVYYDMNPYWQGDKAATKLMDYLERLCSSLNEKNHCIMILLQLKHNYKELQHYNKLMLYQQFEERTRQRRGLVNGVGYVANSLFGVLDERFAEQYKNDIQLVKQNERHLAQLLRNQTSVIEAEYNILKRTEQNIQSQHKTINTRLIQLDNAVSTTKTEIEALYKTQEFSLSAITAINLIQNLKGIQDILLDTITDVYHGKFNTHLITPTQLQRELQFISGQLTKDITLPGAMNTGADRDWDTYKEAKSLYKKRIRYWKSNSWRKFCESINSTPQANRVRKLLAKQGPCAVGNLRKSDGTMTLSQEESNTVLLQTHFPGCQIEETPRGVEINSLVTEHCWQTACEMLPSVR
ncbi:hypothetical protein K1T71_015190 [Dendrolimus kikuchii]|nr:hypothetical protein K1T71_015190 [Dendrolimus kikuchii]